MKHSLFASAPAKLFSGVLLFALLQACGGGGGDGDSQAVAADLTQEQASVTVGSDASTSTDSAANSSPAASSDTSATDSASDTVSNDTTSTQKPGAPTEEPIPDGMFPTSPSGFPISAIEAEREEYLGTWYAVNPGCESTFFELNLIGHYSKEHSLFISKDVVERRVDIFQDSKCLNKAVQMTYSLYWLYSPIDMPGHDNTIRIKETTENYWYHLDGGVGFRYDIPANKPDTRFIITDVHDGKLYFTPSPNFGIQDYPKRLNPALYYTK